MKNKQWKNLTNKITKYGKSEENIKKDEAKMEEKETIENSF